jgi:hypothetical protein
LLNKGFKIRGFGRANIEKTYLRTEVDLKSRGLLGNSHGPGRTQSHDNLPTPDAVARINATSSTLAYKEVKNILHFLSHFWENILLQRRCSPQGGLLKLDAVDAVDAVDALHPHLLKLDAVHPVPTKTGCSASSTY